MTRDHEPQARDGCGGEEAGRKGNAMQSAIGVIAVIIVVLVCYLFTLSKLDKIESKLNRR